MLVMKETKSVSWLVIICLDMSCYIVSSFFSNLVTLVITSSNQFLFVLVFLVFGRYTSLSTDIKVDKASRLRFSWQHRSLNSRRTRCVLLWVRDFVIFMTPNFVLSFLIHLYLLHFDFLNFKRSVPPHTDVG